MLLFYENPLGQTRLSVDMPCNHRLYGTLTGAQSLRVAEEHCIRPQQPITDDGAGRNHISASMRMDQIDEIEAAMTQKYLYIREQSLAFVDLRERHFAVNDGRSLQERLGSLKSLQLKALDIELEEVDRTMIREHIVEAPGRGSFRMHGM